MNGNKIKECPFCGGESNIFRVSHSYREAIGAITDTFYVKCTKCEATSKTISSDVRMSNNGEIEVRINGAEEVIKLWNTRININDSKINNINSEE